MEHLEHLEQSLSNQRFNTEKCSRTYYFMAHFLEHTHNLGENMKIIGLSYAEDNNISFGDNWAIRVTSPDDDFRTMRSVESIVFVPALGLFSKQDRRNYDTYEIKCFDGKTVSLPADKYMALYE